MFKSISTFIISLYYLSSCSNAEVRNKIGKQDNANQFLYNREQSNLLMVSATININDTVVLALDNGTHFDDMLILNRNKAFEKGLISDTTLLDIIKFQKDTLALRVGDFNFLSYPNQLFNNLPLSKQGNMIGFLGKGFLKDKVLKIDYENNFFTLDTALLIDTSKFQSMKLIPFGFLYKLPLKIYDGNNLISDFGLLDLGSELSGIIFAGKYAQKFKLSDAQKANGTKSSVRTSTGEKNRLCTISIDSVLFNNMQTFFNIKSNVVFAENGIAGSDYVLFGNDLLSNFGSVVIDFKTEILYVIKK